MVTRSEGLRRAIEATGGIVALARAIGVSPNTVQCWWDIPKHRLSAVSLATGLAPSELRPDLYEGKS